MFQSINNNLNKIYKFSGYLAAFFLILVAVFTFVEGGHIRITLFLEKASSAYKRFLEIWCLIVATIFSGYLSFYLWKMLLISYDFQERSEGADEILIWIPQTSVAIGSLIFFIAVSHKFILTILNKNDSDISHNIFYKCAFVLFRNGNLGSN